MPTKKMYVNHLQKCQIKKVWHKIMPVGNTLYAIATLCFPLETLQALAMVAI